MTFDSWVQASGSRVRRLAGTKKAVTPEMIDTGLDNEHPKEPAGYYHEGTVYLAVVSWNHREGAETTDKRPTLFVSDRPDGEFEQVSLLADTPDVYEHASAITVHDGHLYFFYSDKAGGYNDIHLKHAPTDDVPANPEGWIDEGIVLDYARDPGLWRLPNGSWRMFFSSEGFRYDDPVKRVGKYDNVGRVESDDLLTWENRTDPVYTEANNQAPDVVPKYDGSGYWLVVTNRPDTGVTDAVAGEAEDLDDQFMGTVPLNESGYVNGEAKEWFSEKCTHFDYLKRDSCTDVYVHRNRVVAYFEGRGGGSYSVGVAFAQEPEYSRIPYRDKNLAAYYPAQEGSGDTLHDESGNGNHVEVAGATWTESLVGSALDLGASGGIDVDAASLPTGEDPFTVLCLARKTDASAKTTWFVWGDGNEHTGLASLPDGNIRFDLGDDYLERTPPSPYTQGSYHLLAGVYDPTATDACRLYYDGLLLASGQKSVDVGSRDAYIGCDPFDRSTCRSSTGDVAHLSVYEAALDRADIENVHDKFLHG